MLTAPDETYAQERTALRRAPRRDLLEDFADADGDGGYAAGRRRTGLRVSFKRGVPPSRWGRVAGLLTLAATILLAWAAATTARHMILRDHRFILAGSSSIVTGVSRHVSRTQLIEVFAEDLERNILRAPLEERKADLEQIPWVKHATVMRLLPDRISVVVEERTPVAFVRQGADIGLVDDSGVLFELASGNSEVDSYSFPVVTGISTADPLAVRAVRIRILQDCLRDLDAGGERISSKLSEVDLSNPEDIKALIPDHGTDVLVHFGNGDYLNRYRRFEEHLSEWRSQYPKLSSVDMRYERQVVLEMQAGTSVPSTSSALAPAEHPRPGMSPGRRAEQLHSRAEAQDHTNHLSPKRNTSPAAKSKKVKKAGRP